MNAREQLLSDIEAFLADRGMAPTTFGKLAMRDPRFMARFRAGADVTLITAEKLRTFMREYSDRPLKRSFEHAVA